MKDFLTQIREISAEVTPIIERRKLEAREKAVNFLVEDIKRRMIEHINRVGGLRFETSYLIGSTYSFPEFRTQGNVKLDLAILTDVMKVFQNCGVKVRYTKLGNEVLISLDCSEDSPSMSSKVEDIAPEDMTS
jgi:hypothetical protein